MQRRRSDECGKKESAASSSAASSSPAGGGGECARVPLRPESGARACACWPIEIVKICGRCVDADGSGRQRRGSAFWESARSLARPATTMFRSLAKDAGAGGGKRATASEWRPDVCWRLRTRVPLSLSLPLSLSTSAEHEQKKAPRGGGGGDGGGRVVTALSASAAAAASRRDRARRRRSPLPLVDERQSRSCISPSSSSPSCSGSSSRNAARVVGCVARKADLVVRARGRLFPVMLLLRRDERRPACRRAVAATTTTPTGVAARTMTPSALPAGRSAFVFVDDNARPSAFDCRCLFGRVTSRQLERVAHPDSPSHRVRLLRVLHLEGSAVVTNA